MPLNLPTNAMRDLNPDPDRLNHESDVSVFHNVGGRKHFKHDAAIEKLPNLKTHENAWIEFKRKLAIVPNQVSNFE